MAPRLQPFSLQEWIDAHREALRPPVGNKVIWEDSEFIVMVVGGPNARNDFHIDPGDEVFYQLQGNIVVEIIDAQGQRRPCRLRAGDVMLCPAMTPHSPQRGPDTLGLVIERKRRPEEKDGFAWFCERCNAKLHEVWLSLQDLEGQLKAVMEAFYADERRRTCTACGAVLPVPTGPRL
ncbi:MAG: 3-hydroxyanthranilate 3,4-dioxygenase [Candidatus Tectimicrobiota bacterium]|nr:MAG: 3-hydroxyanthranilate 3,4-dioxygenase [Candidatus Tectomicrobia bacterium]